MFSATKFAVAGAVVALFGGFLLAGVLTQQPSDEQVPAVGASASASAEAEPTVDATSPPEAEPESTSDMPALTTMSGTFGPGGTLGAARDYHTTTRLRDGRVLVVGGHGEGDQVSPAELWDPDGRAFVPTDTPEEGRYFHTATLLSDGRVLVIGGVDNTRTSVALDSAELWDPVTGEFSPTGSPATRRHSHTATSLADGRVLVVGGGDLDDTGPLVVPEAEVWDPTTETFSDRWPKPGTVVTQPYSRTGMSSSSVVRMARVLNSRDRTRNPGTQRHRPSCLREH